MEKTIVKLTVAFSNSMTKVGTKVRTVSDPSLYGKHISREWALASV